MDKKRYLLMCEQLGKEPVAEELPADFEDFPYIVQVAIIIFGILPDVWEGFSGTYMGKNFSLLPYLAKDVYKVDDHPQLVQIITLINKIVMDKRAAQQKARQKKNKNLKKVK